MKNVLIKKMKKTQMRKCRKEGVQLWALLKIEEIQLFLFRELLIESHIFLHFKIFSAKIISFQLKKNQLNFGVHIQFI
jgi:hypothetical protein